MTISGLAGQLKKMVRQQGVSCSLLEKSDEKILETFSRCECGEIHITSSQLKNLVHICADKEDFLSRRDSWNSLECKSGLSVISRGRRKCGNGTKSSDARSCRYLVIGGFQRCVGNLIASILAILFRADSTSISNISATTSGSSFAPRSRQRFSLDKRPPFSCRPCVTSVPGSPRLPPPVSVQTMASRASAC